MVCKIMVCKITMCEIDDVQMMISKIIVPSSV